MPAELQICCFYFILTIAYAFNIFISVCVHVYLTHIMHETAIYENRVSSLIESITETFKIE